MGTGKYENSESFEEMARTQEQETIPESIPKLYQQKKVMTQMLNLQRL